MAKFDSGRHRVVAVPYHDDDPERGQHFHVDLDDLVGAAGGGDGDSVNPFLIKRLESIEGRLTELAHRVDGLEARPHISDETMAQLGDGLNSKIQNLVESHVNRALGDLRSRVVSVEKSTAITTTGADPDSSKLAKLASAIQSFGEYVERVENDLEGRVSAVEQACAEVTEHITETNLSTMKLSTRLYRALKALEHDEAA